MTTPVTSVADDRGRRLDASTGIVAANVLLGINQGFAWSMTVLMKIDLAGPAKRGLAMGLNEFAGYGAVGLTALLT